MFNRRLLQATSGGDIPPLVNYNFKLTIGQNYDVEMGYYQSGFF